MTGEYLLRVDRHDGKELAVFNSRHEAVGFVARCHNCNDYEIQPVLAGVWAYWRPRVRPDTFGPYHPQVGEEVSYAR